MLQSLDHLLITGRRHLAAVLREYLAHHNRTALTQPSLQTKLIRTTKTKSPSAGRPRSDLVDSSQHEILVSASTEAQTAPTRAALRLRRKAGKAGPTTPGVPCRRRAPAADEIQNAVTPMKTSTNDQYINAHRRCRSARPDSNGRVPDRWK